MNAIVKIKYENEDQSFDNQGWFNATEAAKRFNKRPNDWINLPDTQRYIEALIKREKQKSDTGLSGITNFIKTKKGNSKQFTQGTWLHPKLAVRFAQWLDIDFALWCDEQIDYLIRANLAPPSVQDMIRLMLLPTASTWEKRFPDSYYQALAKVTGTKFNNHIGGSPAIFGDITNKWVYRIIMPKEVMSELRSTKRAGEKMHQWLTNGGEQLLSKQISSIEIIASSSNDYQDFTARCYQAFPQAKGQLRLVMPE
ncbi:KilA-N domain-containing protein [Acinetobacter radioresistens]|uniref:KilA-N domain-containing protein n=1 Tax=Acinetobacter radioresistens TaxID=40216 RepID=UPI0021D38BC5|nr:KilA-N domain-containing protein [Acinetobacter radioresistens]MCU4623471.1 KilA-N domain-containing protein [Acinetobacter radioresistens]